MSDLQQLIDMGFAKDRAEYALKITSNQGVEPAMEWLLAHIDEEIPKNEKNAARETGGTHDVKNSEEQPGSSNTKDDTVAKSLKCDDCGKVLKDTTEVEYHAAKTGHKNFSESTEEKKPLTEEEKKAQLALIEEKLKQKRLEREEREKLEALEREKNRIRSGKDMTEARRKLEEIEMQKIVEQRKREKAEEKAARERVRAQIEADKAARRAREQKQKEPDALQEIVAPVSSTTSQRDTEPPSNKYAMTRIQIRLQNGSTLVESFHAKEQLSAIRVFIQMKTNIQTDFVLMTSFPRRIFTDDDYEKPLEVLGLVPSAVIIVTKSSA